MASEAHFPVNEFSGNDSNAPQAGEAEDSAAGEKKKRDRWSKAPDTDTGDVEGGAKEGDSSKKKSRWGTKQEEVPAPNLSVVPFGSTGSMVPFGSSPSAVTPFGTPLGLINSDQVKIQIRIAEIQSLYGRPR
jgi:hypothetical protein